MISSKNIFSNCWFWPQTWIDRIFLALTSIIPFSMLIGQGFADTILILISITFLVRCVVTRHWQWMRETWFLLAMALWAWMIIISFFAVADFDGSIKRALFWIRFIFFIAALKEWIFNDQRYCRTAALFIAGCILLTIVSLWIQFFFGDTLFGVSSTDSGRLSGPFNAWVAGTFLAKTAMPVLGLATALIMNTNNKRSINISLIYLLSIVILVSTLITGERIAFLSLALAVVIFLGSIKDLRRWLIIAMLFGVLIGGAALTMSPSIKARMVDNMLVELGNFSDSHYGMIFWNATSIIEDHPLTGVGLKNFRHVCQREGFRWYKGDPSNCGMHPHNPYLEWAAETGLPGLLLFVGLMIAMIVRMIKSLRMKTAETYPFALGTLLSLVPFLWPLVSSMSLFTNWNAILFWYGLALAFSFTNTPANATEQSPFAGFGGQS